MRRKNKPIVDEKKNHHTLLRLGLQQVAGKERKQEEWGKFVSSSVDRYFLPSATLCVRENAELEKKEKGL